MFFFVLETCFDLFGYFSDAFLWRETHENNNNNQDNNNNTFLKTLWPSAALLGLLRRLHVAVWLYKVLLFKLIPALEYVVSWDN